MCLPALHISLGIFYRLYTLLEQAAYELDLLLAEKTNCGEIGGSTYGRYLSLLQKKHKLEEQRDTYLQSLNGLQQLSTCLAVCFENSPTNQLHCIADMITYNQQLASKMVSITLSVLDYYVYMYIL